MLSSTRNPVRIAQMCGLAVGLAATLYAQPSVLTWHNDNARTGQNLQETILTPANVNSASFGKLFTIGVDGKVDAQPLYVPHLPIPSGYAEALCDSLRNLSRHQNTFVRAWAYGGLHRLAELYPEYRSEVSPLLEGAKKDEAASVRARLRQLPPLDN